MRVRLPARVLMAVTAVVVGLAFRLMVVDAANFSPLDLEIYEARPYGVDLPDSYGERPFFLTWSRGDGGAFLTLAADPLGRGPTAELGISAYRFGRIGYSLLASAVVLGRISLLPIGLFVANTIAVAGIGWIAGTVWDRRGPLAALLVLNPAVLLAYASDTAEAFGVLFSMVALSAGTSRLRHAAAGLLAITRPTYATAWLYRRESVALLATIALMATGAQLLAVFGLGLEPGGTDNLSLPFLGYVGAWSAQDAVSKTIAIAVLGLASGAIVAGLRSRSFRGLALIASGLLVVMLAEKVVSEWVNLLRAAGALIFILTWWALDDQPSSRRVAP